jgi:hypothetical protein
MIKLGPIHEYLAQDHRRIGALLDASVAGDRVDLPSCEAFRGALLRHIGMEEKVLLPAARGLNRGEPLPMAAQLRADHAALAALVVPTPTSPIIERIRAVLAAHDELEEGPEGLYAVCERLVGEQAEQVVNRLRSTREVPLAPHFDGKRAFDAIDRLLRAAGRR